MSHSSCLNQIDVEHALEKPPDDLVEVGKIIDAYGIKGQLKIKIFNQNSEILQHCHQWWLQNHKNNWVCITPKQLKFHNDVLIATLAHIQNREEAQSFRNKLIAISRSNFPDLSDDEFYWVDLIGLSVSNLQGELFGSVIEMIDTGANSVMRIQPLSHNASLLNSATLPNAKLKPKNSNHDMLVPFVAAYVVRVDLKAKAIIVDWQKDY